MKLEEDNKKFKFEGVFRNEILSAFYWKRNRKQKGSGSFSLELIGHGDVLKGYFVFYEPDKSELVQGEYIWHRKK